jgi:hypothetical protein
VSIRSYGHVAGIGLSLALAATGSLAAANQESQRPDREMLKMMELLRQMEMIKEMEILRDMHNLENAGEQSKTVTPRQTTPKRTQETPK